MATFNKTGFIAEAISTDLHTGSMNSGEGYDQCDVKIPCNGLTVQDVINRSTWIPAQIIKRPDLETSPKALVPMWQCSASVRRLRFLDISGENSGKQKFVAELTARAGRVVWIERLSVVYIVKICNISNIVYTR